MVDRATRALQLVGGAVPAWRLHRQLLVQGARLLRPRLRSGMLPSRHDFLPLDHWHLLLRLRLEELSSRSFPFVHQHLRCCIKTLFARLRLDLRLGLTLPVGMHQGLSVNLLRLVGRVITRSIFLSAEALNLFFNLVLHEMLLETVVLSKGLISEGGRLAHVTGRPILLLVLEGLLVLGGSLVDTGTPLVILRVCYGASTGAHDLEIHILARHSLSCVIELLSIASHVEDGLLSTR